MLGSPDLLADTLATLGYVANWHLIAAHSDYFAAAANASPLQHTWTLAIEEQFYLVWPIAVIALVGGMGRGARRAAADLRRARLPLVAAVAAAGAVASALLMAFLTPVGATTVNRSYYGSDTRAQGLLVGAALAAVCLAWGPVRTAWGRRALWVGGLAGAVGILVMWRMVDEGSALTFHGGFALLALAVAAVIGCVTQLPGHPLAKCLSWGPLPYVGRISYGMYLWYWPVLLVMTAQRTHLDGLSLLGARLAVIVAIAAASFHLLETPIRRGALAGWRAPVSVPAAAVAVCSLVTLVPAATTVLPAAVSAGPEHLVDAGSAAAAGPPVRILLVGDSMAGSLGVGLSTVAARYGAELVNEGSPGCSLAEGAQVQVLWYTDPPGAPCQPTDPDHLLSTYRSLVRRYDPDVVAYLARSDTLNTEIDGTWQHVGEPMFDRWAEARFEQAIPVLSSGGAPVVLLTSPLYDSGEQGDGQPWPENDPTRAATDRRLLTDAARRYPRSATVIDLGAMLSPSGHFATDFDGVPVRCTDGVHLTVPGGQWIAKRLLPRLVALGRAHWATAVARGRRPLGPEPPPSWYAKLPCAA